MSNRPPSVISLGDAIQQFLDSHFSVCDPHGRTFRAYECDLRQFVLYLDRDTPLASIRSETVEAWIAQLKSNGLAVASIKRKVATVRCFFRESARRRLIDASPFDRLRVRFPRPQNVPKSLSLNEARALLSEVRRQSKTARQRKLSKINSAFLVWRNRAALEILLSTGIRVGELTGLHTLDVNLDDHVLLIRGKGGRQRVAFLVDQHSQQAVQTYLRIRSSIPADGDRLFLNAFGTPLSEQGVAYILRTVAHRAGLDRHITPHMLRHTAATLLLENGADIRIVQEFLGHASISTTQRYAHVTQAHLRNVLKRFHHAGMLST